MAVKDVGFAASQAMYVASRLVIDGLSRQGTKSLGNISVPIGGGTPSRSNSDYFTGNIPWITVADLKLRQFAPQKIVTAREFITEEALKNSAARLLPAGSVVLATRVSVGKVGIAEVPLATNQDFASFVPKPGLNNRFLAYCLISSTSKMQEATRGTTIKGIKRDQLLRLEFPLPDEITQENVVRYLDAISEKGAANAAYAASQALPKIIQNVPITVARIEELAARIEEARELRRRAVEEADALMKSTRRRFIGDEPSDGWIPLSTFVEEIENGWSPSCEKRHARENEWGVLKVGCVSFGFYNDNENKALPSTMDPMPNYEVHSGDFLMSRANTIELVGACAIVEKTRPLLMLSDKIFRFKFKKEPQIHHSFLDHVLKSTALRKQIQKGSTGTSPTMKNISKDKVFNLLIPLKDYQEQTHVASSLDALQSHLDALKRHQAETAAELDALLPAVLERAFRGEL